MLHLLYIIVFTILAFIAVSNLVRSLLHFSADSQRRYPPSTNSQLRAVASNSKTPPHPELLDDAGNFINEPFLVMRSISVEDARKQLEDLYENPPEGSS